jgi:hypothetical protein
LPYDRDKFLERISAKDVSVKPTSAVQNEQLFRLSTFPAFPSRHIPCYSAPNPSLKYTEMKGSHQIILKILDFVFYNFIVIICIKQHRLNIQTEFPVGVFVSQHSADGLCRISISEMNSE